MSVSVPVAEPVVRTTVPAVLLVIVGVARLAPVPPVSVSSVATVSELQSVLAPVSVIVGVVLMLPDVGLMASVGVPIVVVAAVEPVTPSVSVRVPVAPVGGVAAAGGVSVASTNVLDATDQPATPLGVHVVELVKLVLVPTT